MKNRKPGGGTFFVNEESSDSQQVHHMPQRHEAASSSIYSTTDTSTSMSKTSISSSISRFRNDFDDLKCKMRIFGESLNLCHCIANDFQNRISLMERRLQRLEDRHRLTTRESNYSAIIQKNQRLSNKTRQEAKKLQMCGTEEEMREVAGRICRNYLHGAWKSVDPTDLDFKRISGGLSNFIYYVALPSDASKIGGYARDSSPEADDTRKPVLSSHSFTMDEPKKVLLRIYGQVHGERAMDAIVTESVIFTLLSERRLGPKLHGVFSGGRIEEYIPARSLLTKELSEPAISMKIAEKMAAIHSMDVPLSKEPNWLWKTMGKWMKTARDERLAPNAVGKTAEEQNVIKELKLIDFEKEIEWLKKFVSSVDSPVVFCHNDLQEGNILLLEDEIQPTEDDDYAQYDPKNSKYVLTQFDDQNTSDSIISQISDTGEPRLVLIDFEYCAYNHRGFDIANHFQEWAYDYTNPKHPFYYEYVDSQPTLEQKEIFIKEYLKHYHTNLSEDKNHVHDPSIDEINQLLYEVEAFTLATHLLWCLWSIVNASKSQIPFGYWEFALCRLEHYMRLKQEILKKDKFGFPQKRKICEVDI